MLQALQTFETIPHIGCSCTDEVATLLDVREALLTEDAAGLGKEARYIALNGMNHFLKCARPAAEKVADALGCYQPRSVRDFNHRRPNR